MGSPACSFRLFVYPLPNSYRRSRRTTTTNFSIATSGHHPLQMMLTLIDMYGLGALLHERAISHRCRTSNASHADLLWISAYGSEMTGYPTAT